MIEAAVLGFGVVGQGIVEMIDDNRKQIERAVPEGIHVKYILDLREFPGSPYADRVVHDIDIILNDPEIRIICEAMGGKEPARTFTEKALQKGISVCTSNKELVAAFGPQLMQTAVENHCTYAFEASVGGGIPLLRTVNTALAQEKITSAVGILNGTTNYILTKMRLEGTGFDAALKEAQEKGYAERNPEADIEGHDTGRKICILASMLSGKTVSYEAMHCEGITKITAEDIAAADAAGYEIKLLGKAEIGEDGEVMVITAPFLVPEGHPLYAVEDVYNGVLLHGTMVDDVMLMGKGAGRYPTASAVVADVVSIAARKNDIEKNLWDGSKTASMRSHEEASGAFYVRVTAAAADAFKEAFPNAAEIECEELAKSGTCAFLTEEMREEVFMKTIEAAAGVCSVVRVEGYSEV